MTNSPPPNGRSGRYVTADIILQFKVTLKDITPPIWRRIHIPADAAFLDLHAAIQDSFGWEDRHLHQFIFGNRYEEPVFIGPRDPEDWGFEDDKLREKEISLSDWFQQVGRTCTYEYDFGDSWEHTVVLEKILPVEPTQTYPRCIAGKRACPPEDCGGIPGYEGKLEILKHPRSKCYKEIHAWMGDFDPEHFDLHKIRFKDVGVHDIEGSLGEA
ncbi:MAG TPA: plasmid pRiA4b ORF-3 family protein [Candidatus Saccharimonadales bacterium]|nr:plasmid pRiA4b ORF-3 family protein [Candidatus Saccharimonadales bacterium]